MTTCPKYLQLNLSGIEISHVDSIEDILCNLQLNLSGIEMSYDPQDSLVLGDLQLNLSGIEILCHRLSPHPAFQPSIEP